MHATTAALLLLAAGTVAVLHSILPDHWVPLAVVARTQRWRMVRVARISALPEEGHQHAHLPDHQQEEVFDGLHRGAERQGEHA